MWTGRYISWIVRLGGRFAVGRGPNSKRPNFQCQRVRTAWKEVRDLLALGGGSEEYPQDAQAKDIPTARAAVGPQGARRKPRLDYARTIYGAGP